MSMLRLVYNMFPLGYIICAGAIFLVLIMDTFIIGRKTMKIPNIKGPFRFPIIGNLFIAVNLSHRHIFEYSAMLRDKYGKVFRSSVFHRLIIIVSDPKLVEILLSGSAKTIKHSFYNTLKPWLGTGLLTSEKRKWFNRRRIITPAFHFQILEQFVDVFDQQSKVLVNQLEKHCATGREFDICEFISPATLDIITETAMGTKLNAQTTSGNDYLQAVNELTKIFAWRFMKVLPSYEVFFSIFYPQLKRRQNRYIEIIQTFTKRVIEERRAAIQDTPVQRLNGETKKTKRMALLDVLLQSTIDEVSLSDEDILEEVNTFMFEGHDTTASAICFSLWEISRNPRVQHRVYQEICEVFGNDKNTSVDMKSLQHLRYIECVIKETLRLYPAVPIIARQVTEDIHYGDGIIPAGAEVLISLWLLGNNPETFSDPREFKPERHLIIDEDRNRFSFIPFSAGPRNCIGQKFAMLEMKTIITKVLQYYELLPLGQDVQPTLNLVCRSENGFQLGLKKREI